MDPSQQWVTARPTLVMTPSDGDATAPHAHPRRAPAHQSVSLLHQNQARPTSHAVLASKANKRARTAFENVKNDSPSSLLATGGNGSSNGSSNADKWFEKSNNEVQDNNANFQSQQDNESPYLISSSETPPDVRQGHPRVLRGTDSLPQRTGPMGLSTNSGTDDWWRVALDDMTIENKKLKMKLRRYQHNGLKKGRLFEYKSYGLSAEHKLELEAMLRKFHQRVEQDKASAAFPTTGYEGIVPTVKAGKPSSSHASGQNGYEGLPMVKAGKPSSSHASGQNTDSAYVSASGPGSSGQSGSDGRQVPAVQSLPVAPSAAANHKNVQSYLHQIPSNMHPPDPTTMGERSKKKLVVRMLEQIFAGVGARMDGHLQPQQQQEVSHSAAKAEKVAIWADGLMFGREGAREAPVMGSPTNGEGISKDFDSKSDKTSRQQRPTRPLDLDLHRAQVPADNVQYIRHLGFSPPDLHSRNSPVEGHGWMYLNLLINMAQLHTLHVTPDYVRKAINEISKKIEVSDDGRKARWIGRTKITRTSSNSGESSAERTGQDTSPDESPRKRMKLGHHESRQTGGRARMQRLQAERNKLMYTPIFSHKSSSDGIDSSSENGDDDETMESPYVPLPQGDSSGMTSSANWSGLMGQVQPKKPKTRDDGPIIFYSNAKFCTDLTANPNPQGGVNTPAYALINTQPVGKVLRRGDVPLEKRGPLDTATELPEPMNLADNPIPESMEVNFPPSSPSPSAEDSDSEDDIPLDVTGMGGVWPSDNFSIHIEGRQAHIPQARTTQQVAAKRQHRFSHIFNKSLPKGQPAVHREVLKTSRRDLAPARLPPALAYMNSSSGSSLEDESDDDGMSVASDMFEGFPPAITPQAINMHFGESEEEEESEFSDDESDAESDGSLDLLAAARQVDPEAVRLKEREYDANMAERLADEIPAGSSAATAGGGSGFASPAHGVDGEEYRRAKQNARQLPSNLVRATRADSTDVQGIDASDEDEEDKDEDDDDQRSDIRS